MSVGESVRIFHELQQLSKNKLAEASGIPQATISRFRGGHMRKLPNNALERTVRHHGRTVLAMDCALAGAKWQRWPAAEQKR